MVRAVLIVSALYVLVLKGCFSNSLERNPKHLDGESIDSDKREIYENSHVLYDLSNSTFNGIMAVNGSNGNLSERAFVIPIVKKGVGKGVDKVAGVKKKINFIRVITGKKPLFNREERRGIRRFFGRKTTTTTTTETPEEIEDTTTNQESNNEKIEDTTTNQESNNEGQSSNWNEQYSQNQDKEMNKYENLNQTHLNVETTKPSSTENLPFENENNKTKTYENSNQNPLSVEPLNTANPKVNPTFNTTSQDLH